MIEFNGTWVTDVAPVNIVDIQAPTPKPRITTKQPPASDGRYFMRRTYDERAITITFDVQEPDIKKRLWYIDRISEWLAPREPKPLRLQYIPDRHLMAVCTATPSATLRDWWSNLTITFTAHDPAFISDYEKQADIGTRFVVTGAEQPYTRIEYNAAGIVDSPRWTHSSGKYIEIPGEVYGSGIALDWQTRTVRNANQALPITLSSRWFALQPGKNEIAPNSAAGGVVYWTERWI